MLYGDEILLCQNIDRLWRHYTLFVWNWLNKQDKSFAFAINYLEQTDTLYIWIIKVNNLLKICMYAIQYKYGTLVLSAMTLHIHVESTGVNSNTYLYMCYADTCTYSYRVKRIHWHLDDTCYFEKNKSTPWTTLRNIWWENGKLTKARDSKIF